VNYEPVSDDLPFLDIRYLSLASVLAVFKSAVNHCAPAMIVVGTLF
jgi:hypothetical protein